VERTNEPHRVDVAVVGAGLAGLAAARLARLDGCSVVVIDPHTPGGRGTTDDRRGYRMHRGPRAVYIGGPADRVLTSLGVRLTGPTPRTDAWGVAGDLVGRLPAGPATLLRTPLLGLKGKVALGGLLSRLGRVRTQELGEVSWAAWLDGRRLPADAAALVGMLARVATYSNAPDVVSADVVIGQLQAVLDHGVRYVDGGWQTFVDALTAGLDIRRCEVTRLVRDGDSVVVHGGDGPVVVARSAVVAVGTPQATASVLGLPAFDVGPPAEAACLDLGTSRPAGRGALFGVDRPLYASDHGGAARLAPHGGSVVHVARYLEPGEDRSPAVVRAELRAHARLAGVPEDDVVEERYLHRMAVVSAVPTAARGGLRGRPPVTASGIAGVFLAGDWVGPEGHLLDASIASALAAARRATEAAATTLVRR
jgi:phytoene dehydrogenase-like protein